RERSGAQHGFLGCAVELAPAAEVALRLLQHLLATLARLRSALGAWHRSLSSCVDQRYGTRTLSVASSAFATIWFWRACRRRLGCFFSSLCCFHAPARLSLPLAVFLSRLRAARFVFIFGIVSPQSSECEAAARACRETGCPRPSMLRLL